MNDKPDPPKQNSEDDFWDLDDGDLDSGNPAPAEETEEPPAIEYIQREVEAEVEEDDPAPIEDEAPPQIQSSTEDDDSDEVAEEEPEPVVYRRKKEHSSESKPVSMAENLMLGGLVALVLGLGAWGLMSYFKNSPWGDSVDYTDDLPVSGETVTINEVETWFRKPIREGEKVDQVTIDAQLIPCARVKVSGSDSGQLLATFRDENQELVGDPISLEIRNGKFARTNSEEIEINSTDGVDDIAWLPSYQNGDFQPWSLVITEGETSDDEALIRIPIMGYLGNPSAED